MSPMTVTVSQVNKRLATIVKGDKALGDIIVRGEISNFKFHYSGHVYFSLKDEGCSIKAVMFRSSAARLTFEPADGMNVLVRCSVQVYEASGACQLYVSDIQPDGAGEQSLAFGQIKEKLEAEGLFGRKRPIPAFPKKICVITSESGAALQDIINVIGRRYPLVKLLLIPATVQGSDAAESVTNAVNKAQSTGADVIIIGRGGGSAEDLGAFNSEKLARAVFASKIPTISAVGHETDTTLCDYVADMRAPTPSAAAELAVPDAAVILSALQRTKRALYEKAAVIIENKRRQAETCSRIINSLSPKEKLEKNERLFEMLKEKISSSCRAVVDKKQLQLERAAKVLDALSPMNTLSRGYSIVYKNDTVVGSVEGVSENDRIVISVADGTIEAVITKTERKPE